MNTETIMQAAGFLGRVLSVNQNKKVHEIAGSILAAWLMFEGFYSFMHTTGLPWLQSFVAATGN